MLFKLLLYLEGVVPITGSTSFTQYFSNSFAQLWLRCEEKYLGLILVDESLVVFIILKVSLDRIIEAEVDDAVDQHQSHQQHT